MSQFFQRRRVAQVASHEALWYSGHGRPAWRTHLLAIAITSDTIGSSTTTPQLYGSTALGPLAKRQRPRAEDLSAGGPRVLASFSASRRVFEASEPQEASTRSNIMMRSYSDYTLNT